MYMHAVPEVRNGFTVSGSVFHSNITSSKAHHKCFTRRLNTHIHVDAIMCMCMYKLRTSPWSAECVWIHCILRTIIVQHGNTHYAYTQNTSNWAMSGSPFILNFYSLFALSLYFLTSLTVTVSTILLSRTNEFAIEQCTHMRNDMHVWARTKNEDFNRPKENSRYT